MCVFVAFRGEPLRKFGDGFRFLRVVVEPMVEHLYERPLCPFVVFGVAGADFTVPVVGETDFVELFPVTGDVFLGGHCRMLPRLDGILFRRQPVSVVPHGVEHIESFQPFVAGINVGGDVSQRVSHVQSCAGRIGKHVQHVVFRFGRVCFNPVSMMFFPIALPLFLDFLKIVFHSLSCYVP